MVSFVTQPRHIRGLTLDLLDYRREAVDEHFWPWLSDLNGRFATKKRADKFLLGAVIDYQMKADTVWENARRFSEDQWNDPKDLWVRISRYSHSEWMREFKKFHLHRFPKAHERVWRVAQVIVTRYDGDARNIWKLRTPEEVLYRLHDMRMGTQISRMVVGALLDTKQISGSRGKSMVCVKADVNVCRVLGRSVYGVQTIDPSSASDLTRIMYPKYPWKLDASLFSIGSEFCRKTRPFCSECPIEARCRYRKNRGRRRR